MKKFNEDDMIHYQWYSGDGSWGWEVLRRDSACWPVQWRHVASGSAKSLAAAKAASIAVVASALLAEGEKIK